MRLFERFDGDHTPGRILIVDTNEPRILRLPWELLRDEGGYLFAKNPPVTVIRRMHQERRTTIVGFEPPVRILMVTCRPDGAGFIDPRSIATPLLDALDSLPEHFEVEFLRPPTLSALDDRLRDTGKAQVHIVHFDGHGVYDRGVGLGFLLFEDENHEKRLVDAEQLGTLLNESGIPLMVLNACQSAQPDDRNPFGSVASRLIESGVGGVVAMNYSVLVETAKRFTARFYSALAHGQTVNIAMDTARRDLFRDTRRATFMRPNQEEAESLHLQDWFLPALYQQAETLTPFQPDGKAVSAVQRYTLPRQPVRGGFPPSPLHGFHGRARELLDLERAFATREIVVLHGFGGQGKTALATQAAEWFTRTHLFDRAAFLSFETGASLEFVLNELGNALVDDDFQIHEGDKVEAIAKALQETPTLVVFDNFESALPGGNAPMQELQPLLDAAAKWFTSPASRISNIGSRLLITTRNADISHPSFTPGINCIHRELEGLAASDALELAASILEAHSLPRPPRLSLERLLDFLKGHPLSLQLAIPQLRHYSAEQLVEQYQTILPSIKEGKGEERNESLQVSLKFSLDRLGAEAVDLLSRLWVFEGGAIENVLLAVTEIPEAEWNALKPQLTSTALIRLEEIPGVTVPFVHFHPTLAPYLRAQFTALSGAAGEVEARYWQVYYQVANQLYYDDNQHPSEARAIVLRELPNLKRALQLALAAGVLDEAVDFANSFDKFLDNFGRWRERDEIADLVRREVESQKSTSPSGDSRISRSDYLLESGRGERFLQQGRAAEAENVFRMLLEKLEAHPNAWSYEISLTLQRLGRCLSAQGHSSQAGDVYRRAITLAEKLEQNEVIKNAVASCHGDLADVLRDVGKYVESQKEYESALALARETNNERHEGVFLGQLGTLAMMQGDMNEARKRYLEALGLFQHLGEDQMEAVAWHQLGMVAQEARDWDEAERCYKKSLTLKENLGDWALAATSCNQLAIVAKNAGRPQEAERWYLREIEIDEKLGNPKELAVDYSNLASLYLSQNRLDEAEDYARRTLIIKETLDISSEPWKTYGILAQIAGKRDRMNEAREWRRREQESFAAFAGSDTKIKQWQPVIAAVVAAAQGNAEAKTELEPFLQQMGQTEDWKNLVQVLRRIIDGEYDESLMDDLDRTDALIVRRVLQALSGDNGQPEMSDRPSSTVNDQAKVLSSEPSPAGRGAEEQGITLPQLLELVERAAGGDHELGGKLFPMLQQMARDAKAPKEVQILGDVLVRVMAGVRDPDLTGLPDELASAIRGMLGRLRNK
jgi:tetratricopeptide (TPR) repeat protein